MPKNSGFLLWYVKCRLRRISAPDSRTGRIFQKLRLSRMNLKHLFAEPVKMHHFGYGFARRTFLQFNSGPSNRNDGSHFMIIGQSDQFLACVMIYETDDNRPQTQLAGFKAQCLSREAQIKHVPVGVLGRLLPSVTAGQPRFGANDNQG
jgi:hypothetical protein